jgi:hypothetical protein
VRRFYFHVRHDGRLYNDSEGVELASVDGARRWAGDLAQEIMDQRTVAGPYSESSIEIVGGPDDSHFTVAFIPGRH